MVRRVAVIVFCLFAATRPLEILWDWMLCRQVLGLEVCVPLTDDIDRPAPNAWIEQRK